MEGNNTTSYPVIMSVELEDVRFHAYHGVFQNERKIGNDFTINLRLSYSTILSAISDELNDTISYADLYNICRNEMKIPSALLEDVAARIAHRIVSIYTNWHELEIRIRKDGTPVAGMAGAAAVGLKVSNPIIR